LEDFGAQHDDLAWDVVQGEHSSAGLEMGHQMSPGRMWTVDRVERHRPYQGCTGFEDMGRVVL
jgi:hypothetical protein